MVGWLTLKRPSVASLKYQGSNEISSLPPENPDPPLSTRIIAFSTFGSKPKLCAAEMRSASFSGVASCARSASSEKPGGGSVDTGGGGAGGVTGGGGGVTGGGGAGGVTGG